MKLYPLLVLIFLTLFALSCSDDKEEQAPDPTSNVVTHAEMLGVFEVQNSQSATIGNGDIWNIKVKNMNNDCSKLKPYTFANGAISINAALYTIERTEDENIYTVSTTEGSATITFSLVKTKKECGDGEEEEEEVVITKEEIIGIYKVVEAYSYQSGEEPVANLALLNNVWDIQTATININCATDAVEYSYAENTITVDGVAYQVEKEDGKLLITYIVENTITTVHLETTTETCPEKVVITKEEIIGTYKVVKAYSYQSGEEAVENPALLNNIWDIQDAAININCATAAVEYSYGDNTITANSIAYQVEKGEGKLLITYIVENTITTVHLETTTETCTEEEEGDGPEVGTVLVDKMYGYAEAAGTIGGEGGTVHHFDNGSLFTDWLKLREKAKSKVPAIVWLSGTFTKDDGRDSGSPWFDVKDTDNLTIYGTNDFKMKSVGLFLVRANNVIIRNLYIEMPKADGGADGISMQNSSKIWVDHCTFESLNQVKDYEDGSCDITHGTSGVTVSWNRFIQTQKTALVGHSNSETGDVSITATFHHNYFEQSSSRHPRVRFGKVHVYNNFYEGVTTYGAGSAYGAMVLIEGNYFDGVRLPTDICTFPAKQSGSSWVSNLQGSEAGYLYESHNVYANKPANASETYPLVNLEYKAYEGEKLATALTRTDFLPPYQYITTKPEDVNTLVKGNAGVGILTNFAQAPIEVENGGLKPTDPEIPVDPEGPGTGEELGEGWKMLEIGGTAIVAGKLSFQDGAVTMVGSGKAQGTGYNGFFIHREVEGDFEATVKLENYAGSRSSNQGFAGILFVEDLSVATNQLMMAASGKAADGTFAQYSRVEADKQSRNLMSDPTTSGSDLYLKLRREGNAFYSSYSLDGGATYGDERKQDKYASLPAKINLGLSMNSSEDGEKKSGTATFSDFKINGTSISFKD